MPVIRGSTQYDFLKVDLIFKKLNSWIETQRSKQSYVIIKSFLPKFNEKTYLSKTLPIN